MGDISSRIMLEGVQNARDLSGMTANGIPTARFAFVRCETPAGLTEQDIATLLALGLKGVIDLRGHGELEREPNPFAEHPDVAFYHIPLMNIKLPPHFISKMTMGDFYVQLLDQSHSRFLAVFKAILKTPGTVLFHCTAGKDRTGLIAALLLLNAGVSRPDVVTEYAYSRELLQDLFGQQAEQARLRGLTLNPAMWDASPDYIETAIEHLRQVYGGAGRFLEVIGLTPAEIAALKDRVLYGYRPR